MKMRKAIIGILVFLIVLGGLYYLFEDNRFKKIGADLYYVQIIGEGKQVSNTDSYEYTLTGYDKDGMEKTITFLGLKQLRQKAYLKVYVKPDKVVSYTEVQISEIPAKASEKLNKGLESK